MEIGLAITALIVGILIGWTLRTSWLEQAIHIEKAPNGHWLVFFGSRIVGRSTNEVQAKRRRVLLVHALRGTRAPRGDG